MYALDGKGLAAAISKMAFGNKLGVTLSDNVSLETLFAPGFGNLAAEVPSGKMEEVKKTLEAAGLLDFVTSVGRVNEESAFIYGDMKLSMEGCHFGMDGHIGKSVPHQGSL